MTEYTFWLAAIFLPLFPASILFNQTKALIPNRWARAAVLLMWPQIGVSMLNQAPAEVPEICLWAALGTSLLYAVRMLAMRDVSRWIGFLATSTWSLLWLAKMLDGIDAQQLHLFAVWFSVPAAMLSLFVGNLKESFGAAYTGLNMALATSLPRLSGVLVVGVLGAIATPVFPGFFVMFTLVGRWSAGVSLTILLIWFIWSWAAARMIQGLIVGTREPDGVVDLSRIRTTMSGLVFAGLIVAGILLTEVAA